MYRNQNPEPEFDSELDSLVQPGRQVEDYQLPPELPGTLEIGNTVAEGGFAEVFKGTWSRPGHEPMTVAIKRVKLPWARVGDDRFKTRIKRETVIWTTAAHPNILPLVGYQIVDDDPMLVSPWCKNGNLSVYIEAHPEITRSQKIKLLCDAARALVHLHNLDPQIVHGDIKPENVIVQDNLEGALCDFGISKVYVGLGEHTGLTTSGKTGGTSGYQAKELLEDGPATPATDVFAFGGLILEAMSGKQPFWQKRPGATIIAIFSDQMPRPEDHLELPATDPLWDLLRDCREGDASKRLTMSVVLQKLKREIDDFLPLDELPPSPTPSNNEEKPLDQPGYDFHGCRLPLPISGTLTEIAGPRMGGGFGDVYEGLWSQPNGKAISVAIKCLRPPEDLESEYQKFAVRLEREMTIWSRVTHSNILPFFGYQINIVNHLEVPMLVSPWCKNGNLATYLVANPGLTRNKKLKLLSGAAEGLGFLHSRNPPIFHGDIKPQNVIIQDNMEAALCDFGISRVILSPEEHSGWTTSAICSGTSGYQARELIDEEKPTTAADVYAFSGLILATMSGEPPFWRKSPRAKLVAVARGDMPKPEDHPKLPETDPLWGLMRECWSPEPGSRPRTAILSIVLEVKTTDL